MAIKKLTKPKAFMDGWINLLTGLGVSGRDKRLSSDVYWSRMDQSTAEQMYAADDVAAAVVDLIPDEAMREGIRLKNVDKEIESKILEGLEEICADEKLNESWKWARIYGGAGCLLVVDDGLELTDPLDISKVRKLYSMIVFSRWELIPNLIETDIRSKDFGKVLTYRISPQSNSNTHLEEVHHSRVLRFDGVRLPRRLEISNNYWGDSIYSRLENALRNFNTSHDSAASVLQDFTTDVFKMKNLAELVAAGKENDIKTRIELANMSKSVIKAMVLDLEEDYEVKARSLSGVPDLLNKADERLTVAAKVPHTLLLGQSPSGLNATGNSEQRNWYDYISGQQELNLKYKYNLLIQLVAINKGIQLPQDWSWEFKPLWQMSDQENATFRKLVAETDALYIQNGVLDASEVAASRFGGEEYSMETVIDQTQREQKPVDQLSLDAESTHVQTLIFSKEKFKTAEQAKKWAEDHGYHSAKVDETEESFRLRQVEPTEFKENSFKTIEFKPGVKAVIGVKG